jgi:hypothetical protein
MKLSAITAAVTRKLHSTAVNLHIASLRGTVKAANAEAIGAQRAASLAERIADKALEFEVYAQGKARNAAQHSVNVKQAALVEAVNIGGSL